MRAHRIRDTAVARASDDFYPRDNASSHPHVAACAFNSVFLAGLVQPDWDMFHSRHPAAMLHATARAVSGGAVYVSDYPGNHDFDLLHRLVLEDGTVLRALLPGRPTRDCLFLDVLRDNASLLKVGHPLLGRLLTHLQRHACLASCIALQQGWQASGFDECTGLCSSSCPCYACQVPQGIYTASLHTVTYCASNAHSAKNWMGAASFMPSRPASH